MEKEDIREVISEVPVLPLMEKPLFPETLTTLVIARPSDVQIINYAIEHGGTFLAVVQEGEDVDSLAKVGTLAKITKFIRLPNSSIHVFATTDKRIAVSNYTFSSPILAEGVELVDKPSSSKVLQPYTRILKDLVSSLSRTRVFNFGTEVNITNFEESKNLLPNTIFHVAYPYKFHKLFLIL